MSIGSLLALPFVKAMQEIQIPSTVDPQKWAMIESINFSMIETKLCDKSGLKWSRAKARKGIQKYKQWLYLKLHDPMARLVPTELIDDVWHYHILDTKAYATDCQRVFGKFLHHFPYFGLRGGDDADNLKSAFLQTRQLFSKVWGEEVAPDVYSMCDGEGTGCEELRTGPQMLE